MHRCKVGSQTGRMRLNLSGQLPLAAIGKSLDDALWYDFPQILKMLDSQILLTLPVPHIRDHPLRPGPIDNRTRFQNGTMLHRVQRRPR